MTTITTSNGEFLFVEVPDDKITFEEILPLIEDSVPAGEFQFIGTTETITEEQATRVVDKITVSHYKNYRAQSHYLQYQFTNAISSFLSLMEHHSLTGNYAILRKS